MLALLALLALGAGVVSGCGGSEEATGDEVSFGGTALPGVDPANTRAAKSTINRGNVSSLEVAWTLPLTAQGNYGAYASTPVVTNGVIYSQDLESNVQAIELESGEVLWTKRFDELVQGPNGLAVAEGKVYGATGANAFALDQKTGKQLWSKKLIKDASKEAIDMAPGYSDGLVYVSTVPVLADSTYPGGGVGTLYALDVKDGKEAWSFDTVPQTLWGDPQQNAGGGLWYPPSFDEQGSIYFGTGNPAPFPGTASDPWGKSRPGPNLYTNSMVKMDAQKGTMDWYYQQTPHDLYDWDFQNPPVLITAKGKDLAIGSGKAGIVTAVDQRSGKPVWSTAVGQHNGHDDDGLLAMRGEYSKLKGGQVLPGYLGGVIAPIAANETTVFVPVINLPITVTGGVSIAGAQPSGPSGEIVAIDAASGKELWSAQVPGPAYGATTVTNDLVFATSFEGIVHAYDAQSGGEVWQAQLPAGTNSGVTVAGDTLIAAAGLPTAEGQKAQMVAYRLSGE